MDHDVKAVANVFYKFAREDKKYLRPSDYQRLVCLAQGLCVKTLGEPLFADLVWQDEGVPALAAAMYHYGDSEVRGRLETRTRPIKEETPAWKVIRAAWMQFDYEQRHGTSASDVTAR